MRVEVGFAHAFGLAVGADGLVYVSDSGGSHGVHVLTPSGEELRRWRLRGRGFDRGSGPFGIAVDGRGHVYAADPRNQRVCRMAREGHLLDEWRGGPGPAPSSGRWASPWSRPEHAAGHIPRLSVE